MDLGHGLVGWGLNAGIGFGAGYTLGQIHHRHADKWYGKHASRLAAISGKLGAVALQLATGGHSIASGAVDALGQAGLTMMGCEMGLEHARKATGTKLALAPGSAALPAGWREVTRIGGDVEIGQTEIGALGMAPEGRGLDYAQIEELAAAY